MNHEIYHFRTKDQLDLFAQGWQPEATCKGVICLIHGLGEHSSRYTWVAETFCQEGYALYSFDLRGHGQSPGKRGDTSGFESFMDDIGLFLETVSARFPHLPQVLYGHSLGGLLMLNYLVRRQPPVIAAISSAAGLRTSLTEQKLKIWMVQYLGKLFPQLSLPTGLNPHYLSHDPEVVRRYQDDPLVHDQATLRMARETLASIEYVFSHARNINLPLLILHGSEDQLVFPNGSQELSELVPKGELMVFDGLYHEIHNEYSKDNVLRFILTWLDGQMEKNKS